VCRWLGPGACPKPVPHNKRTFVELAHGTLRFAQLRRAVDGISQKVLTNTLRGLERDGIVARRFYKAASAE